MVIIFTNDCLLAVSADMKNAIVGNTQARNAAFRVKCEAVGESCWGISGYNLAAAKLRVGPDWEAYGALRYGLAHIQPLPGWMDDGFVCVTDIVCNDART